MSLRWVKRIFFRLGQALRRLNRQAKPKRPADSRIEADPWLALLFDEIGDRYQLGSDSADGTQVLRRTGRERFNPMRVYLRPATRGVLGDYDVRIRDGRTLEQGRALLDERVTRPLGQLGLGAARETVEEWGGHVITRRYEGTCPDARVAAAAVRFMCEQSEQIIDTAAES